MAAQPPDGGGGATNPFRKGRATAVVNPFRQGRENSALLQNASKKPSSDPQANPSSSSKPSKDTEPVRCHECEYNTMDTTLGGGIGNGGGSPTKRSRTSSDSTPKKAKKVRIDSPKNSPERQSKAGTGTGPNEYVAQTSPSKNTVKHGPFIDSSDESDAPVANKSFTTPRADNTPSHATMSASPSKPLKSILKSTNKAEGEKLVNPQGDGLESSDRASVSVGYASGSQRTSRSSSESSSHDSSTTSGDHSVEVEIAAQLNTERRPGFTKTNWARTVDTTCRDVKDTFTSTSDVLPSAQPAQEQFASSTQLATPAVGPISVGGENLHDHLAGCVLNSHGTHSSIAAASPQEQRLSTLISDNIMQYLGGNGGVSRQNLAERLGRAQSMRVNPADQAWIDQMTAEADERLANPASIAPSTILHHPSSAPLDAGAGSLEVIVNRAKAEQAKKARQTQQAEQPDHRRRWLKIPEKLQVGRSLVTQPLKEGEGLKKLDDERLLQLRANLQPLHEDDMRVVSGAELRLQMSRATQKPVMEEAKSAVFMRMEPGHEEEFKQALAEIERKSANNEEVPLAKRAEEVRLRMANAPPLFAMEDEDDITKLPTLSASSRCRATKKANMVHVYVIKDDEIQDSPRSPVGALPQYDGPSDSPHRTNHADLGEQMDELMLGSALIGPVEEILAERLNRLIPFGQTKRLIIDECKEADEQTLRRVEAAQPQAPVWRELPGQDAAGIVKDEPDLGDSMNVSNDEHQDVFLKDDEDKSNLVPEQPIDLDEYDAGQADRDINAQISDLVDKYGEQDEDRERKHYPDEQEKYAAAVDKEQKRVEALQRRRVNVVEDLPGIIQDDWTDIKTLSALARNVQTAFPLPAKQPAERRPCDRCGRRNHKMEKCKATTKMDGSFLGPPHTGHSPAIYGILQSLVDEKNNNRRTSSNAGRAEWALSFDGANDSPAPTSMGMPKMQDSNSYEEESEQVSLSGGCIQSSRAVSPPVRPFRTLFKPADLPPSTKQARAANKRQKEMNARVSLACGGDGANDLPPYDAQTPARTEDNDMPTSPETAPQPSKHFRTLSNPDDLPPFPSDAISLRGGDISAIIKEQATKEDGMEPFVDGDVEMHAALEMPFPSTIHDHQEAREASAGLGDYLDEVDAQLWSEAMNIRSEVEQDQPAIQQEEEVAAVAEVFQGTIQLSIEAASSSAADMEMFLPSPQPLKMPATPNPFRPLSNSPDPIDAAGLEAFSSRSTPFSSVHNPFRYQSAGVPATPIAVTSDNEDDDEPIKFTPLIVKTETAKVAGITRPAGVNPNGGDEDHNIIERIEDPQDEDFEPDLTVASPKKKNRKSAAADGKLDGEQNEPKSTVKPKRKARESLRAAQTEVPESSDVEQPEDNTKVAKSDKKKTTNRSAGSSLVANPTIERENSDSSKPRTRLTRQSTGTPGSGFETPQATKSGRMKSQFVPTKVRAKKIAKPDVRAEAEQAEASEVDEEKQTSNSKKGPGKGQDVDSGDDEVIESVESPARKSKSKQPSRHGTRSRTTTPRAKSVTAELQDNDFEPVLCYNSHEVMMTVEVGDRVVRLLSKEDRKLYGKVDEYDEFTGPWVVTDIRTRKKHRTLIQQVLDLNLSEEERLAAWEETLSAQIKLSIPKQAQTSDKVSPWVELRMLSPVLDVEGIKEGKLGPAYPLLEDFDTYKALKNRLDKSKNTGGSTNEIRKKAARTGDDDVESSLGLVNLRKNVFVAVVDVHPTWTEDDGYEVEKIRKKKLKLVHRNRASQDDLDQEDTDKWQAILRHKTAGALDNYVTVVQWWVQWAGWPLESCTWEARASFGTNTAVVDHYNTHLDVFLDTPIDVQYRLQYLFDYEDRYIEECRRVVAEAKRPAKKVKHRQVRRKSAEDSDSDARRERQRIKEREQELAAQLFSDDEDKQAAKTSNSKRRPQMDDEPAEKDDAEDDWTVDIFGEHIPAEPSDFQAPIAPMAMTMQPRGAGSPFKRASTPVPTDKSYSVPPLSNERIAGRNHMFSPYKTPRASRRKDAGDFDPIFDVSLESVKTRTSTAAASTSAVGLQPGTQVRISNSQVDRDGDTSMADTVAAKKEAAAMGISMVDIPAVANMRQASEVVEQLAEERLFVQQDPVETRETVEAHAEMDTSMTIGPDGEVKVENSQERTVIIEEVEKGVSLKFRY